MLLRPAHRPALAIDREPQVVLVAGAQLGDGDRPGGAVRALEQVVEAATRRQVELAGHPGRSLGRGRGDPDDLDAGRPPERVDVGAPAKPLPITAAFRGGEELLAIGGRY
jgi:hypothetical protein